MTVLFVQERDALLRLCERLACNSWVALDTEFVRESTYYAKLGLVQVANDDVVACVDPLAVDLAPLLDILYDPARLKVLHSGRQDLEVFHDLRAEVPHPLFDTQIAAALLGHPAQLGYAALVEAVTGTKLPKLHTRTNWEARPLSAEQLTYAADDVIYLREIYHRLHAQLLGLGRLEWLREECEALSDPALYRADPEAAYARLSAGHALRPAAQPLLKALASWRERTAQRRNRPRSWIATDAVLMEIARAAPPDTAALETLAQVTPKFAQTHGAEIVALVREMAGAPAEEVWLDAKSATAAEKEQARRYSERINAVAEANKINPEIIATRRSVLALVRERGGPLTRGWRYALIGRELLALSA